MSISSNTVSRMRGLAAATVCCAIALSALTASPAMASGGQGTSESSLDQRQQVLDDFRASLALEAEADEVASRNLTLYDALEQAQRDELARYFLGEITPVLRQEATEILSDATSVISDGDFSIESTASDSSQATRAVARATTYNVHSTADEEFRFAGILISKTRVWADYVTGSGRVLSTTNYGCQVLNNYDVFSEITVSQAGSSLSGGEATFLCNVVVRRGAPTPWGQINWSTASGIQFMTVNGPGVKARGWR